MARRRDERPTPGTGDIRSDEKPPRYEAPNERPKPTPKPPKRK